MLNYLIEQYIYVFLYLKPKEINKFITISKDISNNIPDSIWYNIFLINHKHKSIIKMPKSITIIYENNHKKTLNNDTIIRNKNIYHYLSLIEQK